MSISAGVHFVSSNHLQGNPPRRVLRLSSLNPPLSSFVVV